MDDEVIAATHEEELADFPQLSDVICECLDVVLPCPRPKGHSDQCLDRVPECIGGNNGFVTHDDTASFKSPKSCMSGGLRNSDRGRKLSVRRAAVADQRLHDGRVHRVERLIAAPWILHHSSPFIGQMETLSSELHIAG